MLLKTTAEKRLWLRNRITDIGTRSVLIEVELIQELLDDIDSLITGEPSKAMVAAGLKYYDYWHGNPHFRELVINLWKVMNRERGK